MRPIHTLIDTKYLTKARDVTAFTASVRSRLSSDLQKHCWVAEIRGNCLIIVTDQAERATLLRYQQHELVKQINEEFTLSLEVPLKRLKVKVDYKLANLLESSGPRNQLGHQDRKTGKRYCTELRKLLNKSTPR